MRDFAGVTAGNFPLKNKTKNRPVKVLCNETGRARHVGTGRAGARSKSGEFPGGSIRRSGVHRAARRQNRGAVMRDHAGQAQPTSRRSGVAWRTQSRAPKPPRVCAWRRQAGLNEM